MSSRPFAKKALVLHRESQSSREVRLCQILEFFGVPCEGLSLLELGKTGTEFKKELGKYAILGPIDAFGELLESGDEGVRLLESVAAVYLYAADDLPACTKALRSLLGIPGSSLGKHCDDIARLSVSPDFPDLTGPMTGLEVSTRLGQKDFVYAPAVMSSQFTPVISADDAPVFLVALSMGISCFIATSSQMVDLDAPVTQGYYDVKPHFCSAVPLIMFLKYVFAQVIWQPVEHGACLIIDDPLLKSRYGHCDFRKLLNLMELYGFTTDIAFIPWNWRRTSKTEAAFFRREPSRFSVSIHGCDHIAAEFGCTETRVLVGKARLAQSRMRRHQDRSGIRHEPIMVFPQGVFSAPCPEVLKRAHFIAAVNTEVVPFGNSDVLTQTRDVWDVAITKYGSFPIFSRRYAHHGLENFAFDLLLGKPCLVVVHHEFFKNEGQAVIELVEKLSSLHCTLHWRPLGDVLRRACRYRVTDKGMHEYWMYSHELWVKNNGVDTALFTVRKKERDPAVISRIEGSEGDLDWEVREGYVEFSGRVAVGKEGLFKVVCKEDLKLTMQSRNLRFELYVAARRLLSELRDECMFQRDCLKRL